MSAFLPRGNSFTSESTSPRGCSYSGSEKTSDRFKVVSSKDGLTLLEEVESGRLVFERTFSLGSSDVDAFSAETYLASRVEAQGTSELTLRVVSFEVQAAAVVASTGTTSAAVEKRSGVVRYEAFAQTLSKEFVEHVKNSWRWRERELVNTMRCALGGLRELHVAGLTHGDLRMNSIVLSEGNSVKLADQFAINFNTISAPKTLRKDSKMLVATCAFLPPECIEACTESCQGGLKSAITTNSMMMMTPAADLWALGVILLEMMLLENVHSLVYDYSNARIKRGILETKIIKAKSFFSRKSKLVQLLETLLSEQSTKRLEAYKFIEEMEQASMTMKSVSFNEPSIVTTASTVAGAATENKRKKSTKGKAKSNKKKEDSCEAQLSQSQTREIDDSGSISSINSETLENAALTTAAGERSSETLLEKDEEKWKLPHLNDDQFLDALLQRQVKNSSRFNHFYAQICDENSILPISGEVRDTNIPCICNGPASAAATVYLAETEIAAITATTAVNSQIVVPNIDSNDVLSMRVETQESERSELANRTLNMMDDRLFLADDISSIASVGPQQVVHTFGLVVQDSQCCTSSSSSSSNTSKLDIHSIRTLGGDHDEHSFEMISIPPLDEEQIYCKKQGIEQPVLFSQVQQRNFTKGKIPMTTTLNSENDENVDISNVLREKMIANSSVASSGMFAKEEAKDQKRQIGQYSSSSSSNSSQQRGILLLGKQNGWKNNRIDVQDEKENNSKSRFIAGLNTTGGVDGKAKMLDDLCGQALERSMRNRENFSQMSSMSTSQLMKQSLSSAREIGASNSSSSSSNSSRCGTDESLQEVIRSRFNQGKSLKQLEEELNSQLRMRENPFSPSLALESSARSSVGSPEMHSQEENLRLSAHFGQLALTHLVEYISQQQQEMESLQSSSLSHRRSQRGGGQVEGDKSIESIQSSKQGLVVAGVSQLLKRQQQQQPHSFVVDHSLYDRATGALQSHKSMSKCSSNSRLNSNQGRGFDCFHEANMTAHSASDSITSLVSGFQQKLPSNLINPNQFNSSHTLLGQKKKLQLNQLQDLTIEIPQSDFSTQKRNRIQLLGTGSFSTTASSFKRIL